MRKTIFILVIASVLFCCEKYSNILIPNVFSSEFTVEQRLYFKAESLFRQGKTEAAIKDFEKVLKLNPAHAGAKFHAALIELKAKNTKKAKQLLESISNDPEYGSKARAYLADITISDTTQDKLHSIKTYLDAGMFSEALKICSQALKHQPNNPDLLFFTVIAALMKNRFSLAEKTYKTLISVKQTPTIAELEYLLLGWKQREEAPEQALTNLLSLKSPDLLLPKVRSEIIRLLEEKAEPHVLEQYLLKEIESGNSDKRMLWLSLAHHYYRIGFFEKAVHILESESDKGIFDPELHIKSLFRAGRKFDALSRGSVYLAEYPSETALDELWLEIFNEFATENKTALTKKTYSGKTLAEIANKEIAKLLDNEKAKYFSPKAFFIGAQTAILLGNYTDAHALTHLGTAKQIDYETVSYAIKLAESLFQNGLSETAEKVLESVLANFPNHPEASVFLAHSYCQSGRVDAAETILEKTNFENFSSLEVLSKYLDALVICGRRKKAHQVVLNILEKPNLPGLMKTSLKSIAIKLGPPYD